MASQLIDELAVANDSKIVFLILDGLGGLQMPGHPTTELEAARTPNMDRLVAEGTCGQMIPVEYGVTPGSGPGHFGLFGYDPREANIGRGVLSAAGLEFDLTDRDVAARVNFATLDEDGKVIDRRAGRIDTKENRRICGLLQQHVKLPAGVEFFLVTEKEHRALFVLRGDRLGDKVCDTDPQRLEVPPIEPSGEDEDSQRTAAFIKMFLQQAAKILEKEKQANALLMRGFAKHRPYKSLFERFKLRGYAIANYPMYRGLARLVGMQIAPVFKGLPGQIDELESRYEDFDFFFIHVKDTDATGEDGNFAAKVAAIEAVDAELTRIVALQPEVLVITGDHSTPSALRAHSWHPVPVLLHATTARRGRETEFSESACARGALGTFPSQYLMNLALAHAGRLAKFGA